jgi:hypothetical protein
MVDSLEPMHSRPILTFLQLLEVFFSLIHPLKPVIDLVKAHGGSYSIYYALAVASNEIKIDHRFVLEF